MNTSRTVVDDDADEEEEEEDDEEDEEGMDAEEVRAPVDETVVTSTTTLILFRADENGKRCLITTRIFFVLCTADTSEEAFGPSLLVGPCWRAGGSNSNPDASIVATSSGSPTGMLRASEQGVEK